MNYVLALLSNLLLGGNDLSQEDLKMQIITAWSARFQQIRTVEYVLDGTELITPDFLTGLADAPESFAVKQRPLNVLCRIDFPRRRVYLRQDHYQWQVHLERFVRRNDQILFDERNNRVDSYTKFFDRELKTQRSDSSREAKHVGRSIELLPIWFGNGKVPFLGTEDSLFAFPDFANDARAKWNIAAQDETSGLDSVTELRVREADRPLVYRFMLDAQLGFLPRHVAYFREGVAEIEMSVSYLIKQNAYVADKWEVTVFSRKGRVERCVALSLKSCTINQDLPDELFQIQLQVE